jgi:hypothetical protein
MRILLVDQFAETGGAQHGLLEAAAGFAARGWELHAAIPGGPLRIDCRPCARVSLRWCAARSRRFVRVWPTWPASECSFLGRRLRSRALSSAKALMRST